MSEDVGARVRAAIEDHGPIGFDEYMRIVLYGPGGFFEAPPVGADGHFVTAPHVHPFVFARCIRAAILQAWSALGEPDPLPIVELGAGDGSLADALLEAFGELPKPTPAYTGVEISSGARAALGARGLQAVERLDELEPFEGVVVANELLDNLPFVPVRRSDHGVREVRVGLDAGALAEVEVAWSRDLEPPRLRHVEDTIVPVGAMTMLDVLSTRLRRGYVVLIDFGGEGGGTGTIHGYRGHRRVTDVLSEPGETDITTGVDPSAVADHARSIGLQAFEPLAQAVALAALGYARWERTMRERQVQLQREGRGAEAASIWETRSRASLLTDPARFGGFWWLVLATEGLTEPRWLASADGASSD
ncbi:MAG: SAM-dependent methyltransferase [Actinobacteria bacterium]|nr:SAM-dependent methyltransferase [Actinomycetota bacterium]